MFSTPWTCCSIGVATVFRYDFVSRRDMLAVTWMVVARYRDIARWAALKAHDPTSVMT